MILISVHLGFVLRALFYQKKSFKISILLLTADTLTPINNPLVSLRVRLKDEINVLQG